MSIFLNIHNGSPEYVSLKELRFSYLAIGFPTNWDFFFLLKFPKKKFPLSLKLQVLEKSCKRVGACLNAEKQQLWGWIYLNGLKIALLQS